MGSMPNRGHVSFAVVLAISLLQLGCPDPPMGPTDCPEGHHSCEDDPTKCCLDTTSHNFNWAVDTIGVYPSVLHDVAIINADNIWAVGEIRTPETDKIDSSGNWIPPYNIVRWDGSVWELMRLLGKTYYDSLRWNPIKAIRAFSDDDIWVMFEFGSYAHWDGSGWESEFIRERYGSINRIWGNSSSDLFFIGTDGNITHYDGSGFDKMESGVTVDLRSISGTNSDRVFVSGYAPTSESVLLEYNGVEWTTRYTSETVLPGTGSTQLDRIYRLSAWEDTLYVIAESGLWKSSIESGKGILLSQAEIQYRYVGPAGLVSNSYSDIFLVGWEGTITHFNGESWHRMSDVYDQWANYYLEIYGVDFKDDTIVCVGAIGTGTAALMIRGFRE